MADNNHRISPEPDRRAYQAAQNIIRLSHYRNEFQLLERMKDRLAQNIMQRYSEVPITPLTSAINTGRAAIHTGSSYDQALLKAESHLKENINHAD